ncbi:uncharacterized protein HaLaN_21193, partial [Haematococcus lacustris]
MQDAEAEEGELQESAPEHEPPQVEARLYDNKPRHQWEFNPRRGRGYGRMHPGYPASQSRDPVFGPRVVVSPRGAPPTGRAGDRTVNEVPQQAKEEREREELSSMLRELTRYVSVQDAMRSLDTVCHDLKKAIKKLDKLFRKS